MNIIGVVFAAVILSAVEAHVPKTIQSRNVESIEMENNANEEGDVSKDSQLTYIKSLLSQLNGEANVLKNDDEDVGSKSTNAGDTTEEDSNEKDIISKTQVTDTSESSISSESDSDDKYQGVERSSLKYNNTRQQIMDYLSKLLNENKDGETNKINRRLDIEDNEDDIEMVDIDNPKADDYNEFVNFKTNRVFSGYGAKLDLKGRSGFFVGTREDLPTNMNKDNALIRPMMTRRGFFNTGYYQFSTPPPITFTKINNRDIIQPMGRLNSFPLRRVQNQDTASKVVFDTNANAYEYEPDEAEQHANRPWN